jgi:hypothetical protein
MTDSRSAYAKLAKVRSKKVAVSLIQVIRKITFPRARRSVMALNAFT